MNFTSNNKLLVLLIGVIAAVIFIPFIGNCPLFDWDEVNFAECAREMIVSNDYSHVQLNYRPFWEKPPFFIWMQALSMNIFGVNEFAARFPNAVCSIVSSISIYLIGKKFHSQKFGLIWAALYATTLLPHFYFKSGIIDPWFNLFIFLSVFHSLQFLNNPEGKKELINALLAGLFLGVAVLTKGPAALLISALTILAYLTWNKQLKTLFSKPFILFVVTTLLVSGSWFMVEWLKGNKTIITEFIDYQIRLFETEDSGHSGPFFYHFVVLLIGCFPASLIFIASYLKYKNLTPYQKLFRKIFVCLFWVVLIVFSIAKTKIVHYSSLCYFPLTFIASIGFTQYFHSFKFNSGLKILYWICAGILSIVFTAIGLMKFIKDPLINSGWIHDEFAVQNLQADVYWTGFEFIIGLIFLTGAILTYASLNKHKIRLFYLGMAVNLLFITSSVLVIVPKIEAYTQHAAIEFYKEHAQESCYVETHNFRSYAYLFYSNTKPSDYVNPDQIAYIENQLNVMEKQGHSRLLSYATSNLLWMEHGKIDRPAYIVCKTKDEKHLDGLTEIHKLYQKNGFSFFVRTPLPPDK
ncbi:ArnT family glycosyltransferase [Aurantibacillus circumpalustris]|uniref:ArnT family glycosyltransferase n=1 Tax=Aurantibacillus circumpalustris TaxID=3036359 RepID=UPI00295BE88E|nr:glycosyltransferase family 39 protein [Aurantibacillus circumpalustris]